MLRKDEEIRRLKEELRRERKDRETEREDELLLPYRVGGGLVMQAPPTIKTRLKIKTVDI